ncbi:MAG TPA: hypothetical protein PKC21_03025 [Oligoflexia bacterium]|nr:hypothetical protein [Oligoflexia bacterium]HMR24306.1 hypothetical protein [Oligoflexia bacterium]
MKNKIKYSSIFALVMLLAVTSVQAKSSQNIENMSVEQIQEKVFGIETVSNLTEYYSQEQINTFAKQYKEIAANLPQKDSTKVKFFFCGDVMAFLTVMGGQGYACVGPEADLYSLGGAQVGFGFELSAGLSLMVYWGDENFIGDYDGGRFGYSNYVGGQALWANQVSDEVNTKDPRGFIVLAGARLGYGGTLSGSMPIVQGTEGPLFSLDYL